MAMARRSIQLRPGQILTLSVEVIRLRAELDDTRLDRANLLAAARATIGAYLDGESDPLCYLRDELAVRGQLPPNEGGYS